MEPRISIGLLEGGKMVDELSSIQKKFNRLILDKLISRPKQNKQSFFKQKAQTSLNLARELFSSDSYLD